MKNVFRKAKLSDEAGMIAAAASPVTADRVARSASLAAAVEFRYTLSRCIAVNQDSLRRRRVVAGDPAHPATLGYKVLRTQLLQKMRSNGHTTLAVTSVRRGEGKSITAANLAIAMAQDATHTALLVDFDFQHPQLAEIFDYKPESGVLDHIVDGVELSSIMVHPELGRLVLLPGRGSVSNASELIASPVVQQTVIELKQRYTNRIVIFDLPAMGDGDDVLAFLPYVDGLLLVVEEGKTRRSDLEDVFGLIPVEKFYGTVLNKSGK